MERIKLQQRELDIIAFDQCRWHIGNNSEECVESWKAGYLFAMKELGQDVSELKVEVDNYEKLGAKTCFLVRIRGAKQHEVLNQTPPRSFSFHIIKMPINNA